MLPILLDQVAPARDALDYILEWGGGIVGALALAVGALVMARIKDLETKVDRLTEALDGLRKEIQASQVWAATVNGAMSTAAAKIVALEASALPREVFDERMNSQDDNLGRIERRVEKIDSGMAHRPTRSEMSMQVPRPYGRPPAPRDDGPYEVETPMPPPPPRPKLPSRR